MFALKWNIKANVCRQSSDLKTIDGYNTAIKGFIFTDKDRYCTISEQDPKAKSSLTVSVIDA